MILVMLVLFLLWLLLDMMVLGLRLWLQLSRMKWLVQSVLLVLIMLRRFLLVQGIVMRYIQGSHVR
jgi:hypothetical protein